MDVDQQLVPLIEEIQVDDDHDDFQSRKGQGHPEQAPPSACDSLEMDQVLVDDDDAAAMVTPLSKEDFDFDEVYIEMGGVSEEEQEPKEEEKEEIVDEQEEKVRQKQKQDQEAPYEIDEVFVEYHKNDPTALQPGWENEFDLDDIFTFFNKPTRDTPIGIAIEVQEGVGPVVVRIKHGSILSDSHIEVGMKLITLNGITFEGMNVEQAIGLFKSAIGPCVLQTRLHHIIDSCEC